MKITNIHNLPKGIYDAIVNDTYDGPKMGSAKISVTTLINPPRIHELKKRHRESLTEDASERLWSLLGSSVHAILERAETSSKIVEERLEMEINGVTITGKMDIMDETTIEDYKVTSVWQYIHAPKEGKSEHIRQLNLLRMLARPVFPNITRLNINMILRDWSAGKAKSSPDFPRIPFVTMQMPVWTDAEAKAYAEERVELFKKAAALPDEQLPECTPEECWEEPTTYAVMKDGGKRAFRVCSTMEEAQALVGPKMHIDTRHGGRRRCAEYCPVRSLCNQYKEYLAKTGTPEGELAEVE